jgi:hypothetical protein
MLISARDDEGDHTGMTDEQLRDELITLMLAAHETTANALTWTWYLLSQDLGRGDDARGGRTFGAPTTSGEFCRNDGRRNR